MPLRIERMTEEDYFRIGKEVKDGSSYRSGEDRPV